MKQQQTKGNNKANGFTRNSFKFISSCIKTVSSGVRSASASVAASISSDSQDLKDQVFIIFPLFYETFGLISIGSFAGMVD